MDLSWNMNILVRNRDFFNMRLVKYWSRCPERGYRISMLRGVQDLTGQGPDFLDLLWAGVGPDGLQRSLPTEINLSPCDSMTVLVGAQG